MPKTAIFLVSDDKFKRNIERVFDSETVDQLRSILDLSAKTYAVADLDAGPELGANVEIILSSWGAPYLILHYFRSFRRLKLYSMVLERSNISSLLNFGSVASVFTVPQR
jgi:hypothetical protein|tara:strand:+ start:1940 stop:2269 length:330 start_codon:yes stop_codon:yes gene_type:complete